VYIPQHFAETRIDELHRIIREYPFGALVINGPDGLDANHLPFELDLKPTGLGTLVAHVARANSVWQDVRHGDEVLVIFRGEDAYISPNWYPSKHESHRQVPTWNYQVVHVHGAITIRDDEKFLRGVVGRLTQTHERRAQNTKPWKMADAPREYIDQMLTAIVGIEIEITRITGKSKLSQNKDERDRVNAANQLRARNQHSIADAMLNAVIAPDH
jgi:transcriptional regulator